MNKKIIIFLTFLSFILPLIILAGPTTIENPLKYATFKELVKNIINFIFWIAVALLPLMIIIGAFFLMTAAGDPKKIETGRNVILYSCLGFIVIIFAWGLIALIQGILGVKA